MSQRLILTALKSARLNGVPFRVRKTEKRRKTGEREGENKMGENAERRHGDGDGGQRKTNFKE